mmetsp:Transcript_32731/g.55972  ORF Transcript_32731/g.55972 Transcript_32731/m.55972 type:complete len:268 (-) Transcript_32731:670-1473(-)
MFVLRHSATASVVSRPRPRQMALLTIPKRWRNLYTKQKEKPPWLTEGPTRKTPGTLVDSSFSVSIAAPQRQPLASSPSSANSKRSRATVATDPSKPVHSTGGWGVCSTSSAPSALSRVRASAVSSPPAWLTTARRNDADVGSGSAAFHLATTLKPPSAAFSTRSTRSGAKSSGRGEKLGAVTSRSLSAVYGASSTDGSGFWTFHVAVEASTVVRLPALARLKVASTPLSYPPMTTKSSPGRSDHDETRELCMHSSAPAIESDVSRGY